MGSPVIGFEITAGDIKKMKSFYKGVFGWQFHDGPIAGVHSIIAGDKKGLKGSFLERRDQLPDYVSLYIESSDMKRIIAKIKRLKGNIVKEPFSPDGKREICIAQDPEGHVITIISYHRGGKASSGKAARKKA